MNSQELLRASNALTRCNLLAAPELDMSDLTPTGLWRYWSRLRVREELAYLMCYMDQTDPTAALAWEGLLHEQPYVAMQELAVRAFNLREYEAILLKPVMHRSWLKLAVTDKGSVPRAVRIQTDFQRQVLSLFRHFIIAMKGTSRGDLSNPAISLQQNLNRYRFHTLTCRKGGAA